MRGLTSLFGMGRGEHPRQNHHKNVNKLIAQLTIMYILGVVILT
jgi:hypothetical protein